EPLPAEDPLDLERVELRRRVADRREAPPPRRLARAGHILPPTPWSAHASPRRHPSPSRISHRSLPRVPPTRRAPRQVGQPRAAGVRRRSNARIRTVEGLPLARVQPPVVEALNVREHPARHAAAPLLVGMERV